MGQKTFCNCDSELTWCDEESSARDHDSIAWHIPSLSRSPGLIILVCTYSLAGETRQWHLLALNLQRVQSYYEGGGATAAGQGGNVPFIKVR